MCVCVCMRVKVYMCGSVCAFVCVCSRLFFFTFPLTLYFVLKFVIKIDKNIYLFAYLDFVVVVS